VYQIVSENKYTGINRPVDSPDDKSERESETWFERVNKTFPDVNLDFFKETIEISGKIFKKLKKNYGS